MKRLSFIAFMLMAVTTGAFVNDAHAQSLRVLSSNGVRAVLEGLRPDIERTVGHPLSIDFSTASSLAREISEGAPFDVAILTPALLEMLGEADLIAPESYVEFARAGVGVGARSGSGARDVTTPAALRSTLLAAESVAFTAGGQSRATIDAAFEQLDIIVEMEPKTILLGPGEAPGAVAAGRAELVLTLVSEILPVPGLELVGRFPAELQRYVSFAAARGSSPGDSAAADALLRFLAGPALAVALREHGMEPVGRP